MPVQAAVHGSLRILGCWVCGIPCPLLWAGIQKGGLQGTASVITLLKSARQNAGLRTLLDKMPVRATELCKGLLQQSDPDLPLWGDLGGLFRR